MHQEGDIKDIEDDDVPLLNVGNVAEDSGFVRTRLLTVEPAMLLGLIYVAGTIPMLQQYCFQEIGKEYNITSGNVNSTDCEKGLSTNDSQLEMKIQHKTSLFLAELNAVELLPVFISAITLGSLSDNVGRKIGLIIPMIGSICSLIIYTLVIWLNLPLFYLFIGKIIQGTFGGLTLFLAASFSYISDITTPNQRQFKMILLEIFISIGIIIANIGVGYLIKFKGYLVVASVLLGVCVLNLIYCLFLPESHSLGHTFSCSSFHTLASPKQSFQIYIKDTDSNRRWKLQLMAVLITMIIIMNLGKMDVRTLYVLASPFCFTPVLLGYFICCQYLAAVIGSISITKILENRFHEMSFVLIGLISSAGSTLFLVLANTRLLVFISSIPGLFTGLPIGMIRAYNSKLMQQDEQGAMFASIAWLESTGNVIGSVMFDTIYSATFAINHGLVFYLIIAGYALAMLITSGVLIKEKRIRKANPVAAINS